MSKLTRDLALAAYIDDREALIALACRVVESRAVAEEIVQESWLKWHGRDYTADKARPLFRRIVTNLALDWRRRRNLETETVAFIKLEEVSAPDTERVVSARQDLRIVVRVLRRMPKRTVRALRLRAEEGLSYTKIGQRLGLSQSRAHELVEDALVALALALES